jgi:enoyl-CoA hydratase/carnithine racemase
VIEVSDVVLVERRAAVLLLTLNRPAQRNALSSDLIRELGQAMKGAAQDDETRVVLVTGSGEAFCAGADLLEAQAVTESAAAFRSWLRLWRETFDSIEAMPKPVIAVVNGLALAGGLELALACDFIVARQGAKLGDVHANYGLVPGGGGSQRLPDAIGARAARWLMFTGEVLTAQRAEAIGLVQQVFGDETFLDEMWSMAARMATRSAPGLALMKRLSSPSGVTQRGLDVELDGAAELITGPDAQEGLTAFREKRRPHFRAPAR